MGGNLPPIDVPFDAERVLTGHHKHGAYIARHADMPGFSREEQQVLAALVGGQRRKLALDAFANLPDARVEDALALALLLRLAVLLNRPRSGRPLPPLRLRARPTGMQVRFPRGWLARHPLTREDLEEEAALLKPAGLGLDVQ